MKRYQVNSNGTADFKTINEALSIAEDGDEILVASGRYEERLVIDKAVSIIGDEKEYPIILMKTGKVCQIKAKALFHFLEFTNTERKSVGKRPYSMVEVKKGAEFYHCRFTRSNSVVLSCVGTQSENCRAKFEDCEFIGTNTRDCCLAASSNVVIQDSDAEFKNCISRASLLNYGFQVKGCSAPTIANCKIYNNYDGIAFIGQSRGRCEGCEIFDNGGGISLHDEAKPKIKKNEIHDCGFAIYNGSQGAVFENCTIEAIRSWGVNLRSRCQFVGCQFQGNIEHPIVIEIDGDGSLFKNCLFNKSTVEAMKKEEDYKKCIFEECTII